MAKITLPPVTNSSNLSVLNNNFQEIAEALNDLVLYRDNPVGEPNQLENDVDVNGHKLINAQEVSTAVLKIDGVIVEPTEIATADSLKIVNNLSDVENVNAARVNLSLGNVNNTSDLNKPISTATQTALDLKANKDSPTFTGTVGGITKSMVGLGNVDNTADVSKPVSTATQTYVQAQIAAYGAIRNQPYFLATLGANQSVTAGVQTKVLFDTELMDSNGYFNPATNRFTPLIAGKYLVTVQTTTQGASTGVNQYTTHYAMILKNGTAVSQYSSTIFYVNSGLNITASQSTTLIVSMNGTSDFIEGGTLITPLGSPIVAGGSSSTFMQAFYIGP